MPVKHAHPSAPIHMRRTRLVRSASAAIGTCNASAPSETIAMSVSTPGQVETELAPDLGKDDAEAVAAGLVEGVDGEQDHERRGSARCP